MEPTATAYAGPLYGYSAPGALPRRQLPKGYISMAIALACAGAMCAGVSAWFILLPIICVCLAFLSFVNITSAICLLLLLNPLFLVIRNSNPGSVVLAGSRTIWLAILVAGWLVAISSRSSSWPKGRAVTALVFFICYGGVMIFPPGLAAGLMGFRSVITPLFFFLVVRGTVAARPEDAGRMVRYALLSCLLLAGFQYLWFTGRIAVPVLLGQEGSFARLGGGRAVMGVYFDRMTSLIGGGPSNAGVYLGAGTVAYVMMALSKDRQALRRVVLVLAAAPIGWMAFHSLSRSVVVEILAALTYLMFSSNMPKASKLLSLAVLALLVAGSVFGSAFTDRNLIGTIIADSFAWAEAVPTGVSALVGGGLYASGGGTIIGQRETILVDAGWIGIWAMMGLPGLISIIIWIIGLLRDFLGLTRWANRHVLGPSLSGTGAIAAAIAIGLLFGSAHTAIIMRTGADLLFLAMAAVGTALSHVSQQALAAYRPPGAHAGYPASGSL